MALIIPDLKEDVVFRGISLNDIAVSMQAGRSTMIGNRVDAMDVQPPDVVQFTEKLALTDGMDYGPVYLGSRFITIQGVTLDKTRGETWDRLAALEAVSLPQSGTFGLYALTFYAITGSGGSSSLKTIMARPNGLETPIKRDSQGGNTGDAVGIAWSLTFIAMDPAIS